VAQRGTVLGVAEHVLHLRAVAIPVLHGSGSVAAGDVEIGHDERVAVDGVEFGELVERQGALIGVQGAPPAGPRIRTDCPAVTSDNRRASPAAVVAARFGTGTRCCPATSAR
jgi:hypothetical protein